MRFVFVLSICFFILNFSLYSIFNEHELTLEFGREFCMESNPELSRAEFKKNVSQAERPRLTSEDAILSYGFSQPCIFSFFVPSLKARGEKMVEMMGIEPMTPCLQGRCSPS